MKLATIFLLALVSVATSYGDNIFLQGDPSEAQEDHVTDGSFVARVLGRIAQKKRNNRRGQDPSKKANKKAMKIKKMTMKNMQMKNMRKDKNKVCSLVCYFAG